jgi:stage IV sporulation protein B
MLPDTLAVTRPELAVPNAPYTAVLAYSSEETPTSKQQAVNSAEFSLTQLSSAAAEEPTLVQDGEAAAPEEQELSAAYKLLGIFPVKNAKVKVTQRSYVVVGGQVFGIKLYTKGVLVAKTDVVMTDSGNENPSQKAGLHAGDIITHINGKEVSRKQDISEAVANSDGKPLKLTVQRDGEPRVLTLEPVKGSGGKYLVGLWIRDSSAGIGTVTFYDTQSNTMAGLGHAIVDVDTGEVLPTSGGELVDARIMGVYKGAAGKPGELCGIFQDKELAKLKLNSEMGVYGKMVFTPEGELTPVATRSEVKPGYAQIVSTIGDDGTQLFDAEILKVNQNAAGATKNMTIRITDERLISATGGIVQGMSGSPILQDGMLVGAVTHVFVNSPLEGYGIFAETMLETARNL